MEAVHCWLEDRLRTSFGTLPRRGSPSQEARLVFHLNLIWRSGFQSSFGSKRAMYVVTHRNMPSTSGSRVNGRTTSSAKSLPSGITGLEKTTWRVCFWDRTILSCCWSPDKSRVDGEVVMMYRGSSAMNGASCNEREFRPWAESGAILWSSSV